MKYLLLAAVVVVNTLWQLPVLPVIAIPSIWQHFRFSEVSFPMYIIHGIDLRKYWILLLSMTALELKKKLSIIPMDISADNRLQIHCVGRQSPVIRYAWAQILDLDPDRHKLHVNVTFHKYILLCVPREIHYLLQRSTTCYLWDEQCFTVLLRIIVARWNDVVQIYFNEEKCHFETRTLMNSLWPSDAIWRTTVKPLI